MKKSCIRCHHYLPCKDQRKSIIHFCDRFKVTSESLTQEKAVLEQLLGTPFATSTLPGTSLAPMPSLELSEGGFDAFETLKSVLEDKRIVSPDIKIPEGDFKEAPNFYTWCISDEFLDQKPFVMQAMIGTKLFSEYCPTCSDTDWMENGVKVGDSLGKFAKKVALLEYGKCPYCHKTKLHFFRKGLLNPYYELALSAGQRCVVGDTLVLTQDGLVEISEYAQGRPLGFSPFSRMVHNGKELEQAADFYISRPETVFRVRLKNGYEVAGTADHPLYSWQGFKRISNLTTSDYVKVSINNQVFGNVTTSVAEVLEVSDKKFQDKVASLANLNKANVLHTAFMSGKPALKTLTPEACLFMGFWVAEGRHTGICNSDPLVIDLSRRVLTSIFNKRYLKEYTKKGTDNVSIKVRGLRAEFFLTELLGQDLLGGSAKKVVPSIIRKGTKEYITAFLQGLFEGDGGIEGTKVSYYTISKKLAFQVSSLLNNLGILNRIGYFNTWASNGTENQVSKPGFCISIEGKFLEVFERTVGFFSERKKTALAGIVDRFNTREKLVPFYYDKLPLGLKAEFRAFVKELPSTLKEFSNEFVKNGTRLKMKLPLGLETLLGTRLKGSKDKDLFKAMRQHNVALTSKKLRILCTRIRKHAHLLTPGQLATLGYFETFLEEDAFYFRVVRITKSRETHTTYDLHLPKTHQFISNGIVSHNSGKSALFGMMASYLTHRMIKLERPNEVFGLLKANVLQGTFVALTFAQAQQTLWEPFYGHLLEAPWYVQYHKMLDHVEGRHGEDAVYKLKDTFVFYRHRRIQVYPAGPDKRVLRGRTRFVSGVDELGWFPNTADAAKNVKMNATEVYIALERSLLTVRAKAKQVVKSGFYNVPFGYFINISSPSSVRDKIMELVRKSQGSTRTLGMCVPTWKMNPHVPKSALAEEFRNDPIAAMRDYGAEPPLTNSPFISSPDKIEACFAKKPHSLSIIYRNAMSRDKTSSELYAELDKISASGKPSILALDAGFSNNSFAFAIGSLAKNGYPMLNVVGEVMPAPGVRINHSLLYTHLLGRLVERRNIKLVCADRWNSLKVLADMEQEFDIVKRQYSLKYADMQLFKSYIDDRQLLLPLPTKPIAEILRYDHSRYPECFKHLPADHLALQALTVQDTGSAVLKGDGLTDDILRASMLCFRMLVDEENLELLNGPEEEAVTERIDITKFAVSRNYSGGGTGTGGQSNGGQGSDLGVLKQRQ